MTFLAGISVVNFLADSYLCGNHLKVLGDLLADDFHLFTALRTLLLFITELVLHNIGFYVFGKLVKATCLLLALVLLNGNLGVSVFGIFKSFGFIEEQGHLLKELFSAFRA